MPRVLEGPVCSFWGDSCKERICFSECSQEDGRLPPKNGHQNRVLLCFAGSHWLQLGRTHLQLRTPVWHCKEHPKELKSQVWSESHSRSCPSQTNTHTHTQANCSTTHTHTPAGREMSATQPAPVCFCVVQSIHCGRGFVASLALASFLTGLSLWTLL